MLIFNCSKAFAEFIEPKAKAGTPAFVTPPPSPDLANDAALLRTHTGEAPAHLQQWLVHLVRIHRKPCVLAMELNTRYALVFTVVKKGDVGGFINQLMDRLITEMAVAAFEFDWPMDIDAVTERYLSRHDDFRFFQRAHRSAQAHLKEVAWYLELRSNEAGRLPDGAAECSVFDHFINGMLRKTSASKDFFIPAEEMHVEWFTTYAGFDAAAAIEMRQTMCARMKLAG